MSADVLALLDELDALRAAVGREPWRQVMGDIGTESLRIIAVGPRGSVVAEPEATLIVAAVNTQPKLTRALRGVLSLHVHARHMDVCGTCSGEDEIPEPWPCPTVRAVTAALSPEATR